MAGSTSLVCGRVFGGVGRGPAITFAVDSGPAILAVSDEPHLVSASNAFAILGLRTMYFLLANAVECSHYRVRNVSIVGVSK